MSNELNIVSKTSYKKKRLQQVFWAAEAAIIASAAQRVAMGHLDDALAALLAGLLLIPVYFLWKINKPEPAANYMSTVLTLMVLYFMWPNEGSRDEILLVFPAIFTFCLLTGTASMAAILTVILLANIGLMGYLGEAGLVTFSVAANNYNTTTMIAILLLLSCYAIFLMAQDLGNAFADLHRKNQRILESQEKIEHLVHYDALTGLPNRVLANIRFDLAVELSLRRSKKLALMFIDLDNFKQVNDSMGHAAGDELLKEIASRLTNTIRNSDTACRLGGDEFLVFASDLNNIEDSKILGQKILDSVQRPVYLNESQIVITCSIGIAIAPDNGRTFEELCQGADVAMYKGKDRGKNDAQLFEKEWIASQDRNLRLSTDIRHAALNNELEIVYQPKFDLQTGTLFSAEALLRWSHPELGPISPVEFIPIAESNGVIIDVGSWVIINVVKQLSIWTKDYNLQSIAVNVSGVQFKRGDIYSTVKQALEAESVDGKHLELEFTETVLIDDSNNLRTVLGKLDSLGVALSIDDFGTGYSNLAYLKNFDIHALKIDRSFIRHIDTNPDNQSITKAIVHMASSLGMQTVAEGVESQEEEQFVKSIGCTLGQGYFWSKPISAQEFEKLMRRHAT